jgi:hypothetical protein
MKEEKFQRNCVSRIRVFKSWRGLFASANLEISLSRIKLIRGITSKWED